MPFRSGTVSYARFRVSDGPRHADQAVLDRLAAHVLDAPAVGAPPPVQAGWVAGRHVYDTEFTADTVVFGDTLLLGMRVDTNRVPSELRTAHYAMARLGGRGDARAAKEEAEERCREELASGRHLRSRLIPIWWDVPRRVLLAPIFADAPLAALADLLEASVEARIEPLSSGALAREILSRRGLTRDYEDLVPSPFTGPPPAARGDHGRDANVPAVPWSASGPEPRDFLGNEFLLWLWAQTALGTGLIATEAGGIAVAIDRGLDMECAWAVTGRLSLRADTPARLPEAAAAARFGKWPRKAGLIVAARGEQWTLMFQGDRFLLTGVKLPRPDDAPASAREDVEDRLRSLETLDRTMVDLFTRFVTVRVDAGWSGERSRIRSWLERGGRRRAAAREKVDVVTA